MSRPDGRQDKPRFPLRLLLYVLAAILVSETVGILLLGRFGHPVSLTSELVEMVSLAVVLSALVYYSLIRPLAIEIACQRATESGLRIEYTRLEQMTATLGAGLVVIDRDFRIVWANRVVKEQFDCVSGAICHRTFKQRLLPCDNCGIRELFSGDAKTVVAEHMLTNARGETSWYQVIVTPLRDDHDIVVQALELLVPIDARKRMENALRVSEQRFRNLVENSSQWIWEVDAGGRYCYVGPQCRELLGYEPEELLGTTPFDLMPPDEQERVGALFQSIAARHERFTFLDYKVVRKDGQKVAVETSGTPVFDSSGQFLGYQGINRDISERKRIDELMRNYQADLEQQVAEQTDELRRLVAEKEQNLAELMVAQASLGASENRFHQVFLHNQDAIILFDLATNGVVEANPSSERLFGYNRHQLGNLLWSDFAVHDERGNPLSLQRIARDCQFHIDVADGTRSDGSAVKVSMWGKRLFIGNREVIYCSFHDITEKVRLERECKLIQTKLIQTNRMTSLGLLIAGIAHEINNPNNIILQSSQMLRRTWQDIQPFLERRFAEEGDFILGGTAFSELRETLPRLMALLTDSSRRIEGIIVNLREFAIQGKSGLNQSVDANRIVSVATSILQNQIKKHTGHFTLSLAEALPNISGNPQQLEQVIVNLIINAIQSLPSPEHKVHVSTGYAPGTGQIIIAVRDEGCGIPDENLGHVFEPFFSTKLESGGTGLGLAISDNIVKEHGGLIEIDSDLHHGTTVRVLLPVSAPSEGPET